MPEQGRLAGKVAVITGAASGIGRATALRFAQEKAQLVLADLSPEALEAVVATICSQGGEAIGQVTDVSQERQVQHLVAQALERFGQIDIVCNNAGILGDAGKNSLSDQDGGDWQRVFGINVLGAVYLVKHVSPHLCQRQQGAIVNTASVAGIRSGAGPNAYSASKAALINFTRTAACDLGSYNIRVNAVCPGLIETGMTQMVFDYAREAGKAEKLGSRCELKRYGLPPEVANAILFLASDEASYITGQALPVDGGNTASLNLPGMKF